MSRAVIYGESHYFTKDAKLNLKYIMNKKKSVEENIKVKKNLNLKSNSKGVKIVEKENKNGENSRKKILGKVGTSFSWFTNSKYKEVKKTKNCAHVEIINEKFDVKNINNDNHNSNNNDNNDNGDDVVSELRC